MRAMVQTKGGTPIQSRIPATREKVVDALVFRSWWVFLFIALCFLVYSHAVNKKEVVLMELNRQLAALKEEREVLAMEQEDLTLRYHSQSDPEWIKLTLMNGLGLVPEGQTKVYFQKDQ